MLGSVLQLQLSFCYPQPSCRWACKSQATGERQFCRVVDPGTSPRTRMDSTACVCCRRNIPLCVVPVTHGAALCFVPQRRHFWAEEQRAHWTARPSANRCTNAPDPKRIWPVHYRRAPHAADAHSQSP